MNVTNYLPILPPEEVHKHFALEGSRLYRKLATGQGTQLKSRDGNYVVTLFKGHRMLGVDIAWCLIHGNWPMFPIAQISADPLDFSEGNLFPARHRRLRYVQRFKAGMYFHPLSQFAYSKPEMCRADWEERAKDIYRKDLAYVLRLEATQREQREIYLRETRAIRRPEVVRPAKEPRPSRPYAVHGMEWHWYGGEWISVPVACHVADDYRRRIQAWQAGARVFAFDPESRQVHAYLPDGTRWGAAPAEAGQLALF
jgi:hypothetical protein